jgi:hypothetical protein
MAHTELLPYQARQSSAIPPTPSYGIFYTTPTTSAFAFSEERAFFVEQKFKIQSMDNLINRQLDDV